KSVGLHQSVPDAPDVRDEHHCVQLPEREQQARASEQQRCQHETSSEATEEEPIAVRTHHARQMVAHCAERCDHQIDLIRPESALCQPESGKNDEGRADDQEEIAPGIEDPGRAAVDRCRRRDRSLCYSAMLLTRAAAHLSPDLYLFFARPTTRFQLVRLRNKEDTTVRLFTNSVSIGEPPGTCAF